MSEQPWWRVESLDNEFGSEVVIEGIRLVLHLLDDLVLPLEDLNKQLLDCRHLPLPLRPPLLHSESIDEPDMVDGELQTLLWPPQFSADLLFKIWGSGLFVFGSVYSFSPNRVLAFRIAKQIVCPLENNFALEIVKKVLYDINNSILHSLKNNNNNILLHYTFGKKFFFFKLYVW